MITINKDTCIGCGLCVKDCFPKDIELLQGKANPKNDRCFECGHCVAICPTNSITVDGYDMEDVVELKGLDNKIDPTVYLNNLKSRRSIRHFTKEQLTDDEINMILDAGRFSPTGGNRQNVAYTVVRDNLPKMRDLVINQLKTMGDAMVASGNKVSFYSDLWLEMYEEYTNDNKDSIFFDAPLVIVISSDDPIPVGIASGHIETLVYSMGLGMLYSGFSKFAIETSPELQELLEIKEGYSPQAVLVIGHPSVKYTRTVARKSAEVTWK